MTTQPRAYHVRCHRTLGCLTRHYLDARLPSLAAAVTEMVMLQQIGWDSVSLTPAPVDTLRASIMGKQALASGGVNLPQKKGA